MRSIRIGCGAGYSGDRIEPAVELARDGAVDYLVFERLAERTIAIAQLANLKGPGEGYGALLAQRLEAVLGVCRANVPCSLAGGEPRRAPRLGQRFISM